MKKLAIVTTYYNEVETVKAVMDAVAAIEHPFVHILVDDCSSKPPACVLEAYGEEEWFHYIRNSKNMGGAASLNLAIRTALELGAEYIAINDADDISFANRFSEQVAALNADPHLMMIGGAAEMTDQESGKLLWKCYHPLTHAGIQNYNMINSTFVHSTLMYRADVFRKIGFYRENCYAFDYEMITRALAHGLKAENLPSLVLCYNIRQGSMSVSKRRTQVLSRLATQLKFFQPLQWRAYWGVLRTVLVLVLPGNFVNLIKSRSKDTKTRKLAERTV